MKGEGGIGGTELFKQEVKNEVTALGVGLNKINKYHKVARMPQTRKIVK